MYLHCIGTRQGEGHIGRLINYLSYIATFLSVGGTIAWLITKGKGRELIHS